MKRNKQRDSNYNGLRRLLLLYHHGTVVELDDLLILATLGSLTMCNYWLDKKIYLVYIYLTCQCLRIFKSCQEGETFPPDCICFNVSSNEFVWNNFCVAEQVLCVMSHVLLFCPKIFRKASYLVIHNLRSGCSYSKVLFIRI